MLTVNRLIQVNPINLFKVSMKEEKEIQAQIANIQTLMGLSKNLDQVSQESIQLNERLNSFGDLHEEIQDLLSGEELAQDHQVCINLHEEIVPCT